MKFRIVSDSGSNLRNIGPEVEYITVPLTIRAGEREFVDDSSLNVQEMVDYLKTYKGKSGTACPSVSDWVTSFEDADVVFCVTITSGLSGSYNSARLAKEDYENLYPDRHVYIVDSLSAGAEMNLIIEKLEELILAGKDYDTICEEISEYHKNTGLMFSLESLRNLANNGRVSHLVARLAGTLGICVVGCASDKGELDPMSKCRGEKKALSTTYKHMKELGYAGARVYIDHCNNEEAAKKFAEIVHQEYPQADIKMGETYGLCSFYAEEGGLMIGFEKNK